MTTASLIFRVVVFSGAGAAAAFAADAPPDEDTRSPSRRDDLAVRGVFTSDLPDVGRKHSLRLLLHPHFGDLVKYDYFRADIGLKYAVSGRWELSAASSAYFAHGLGDTAFFSEAGFGEMKFRTKYRLGERLLPGWDSAIGGGYSLPTNDPPDDITDGLERFTFFATFARPLRARANIRVFWGVGVDLVSQTATIGRREKNELRDDSQSFSGGFILDRGRAHYTFEARWATTRLIGHASEDVLEFRPGVIWELGRPRNEGMRSRWLLGLGVSTTFGPDGTEFGLGARVRMDLDFKRLWRRGRQTSDGRQDGLLSSSSTQRH